MRFSMPPEELHSLLEAIVESSEDAIYSMTLDGVVLSWNTGAERLYGYSASEMIGQPIHTVVPPEYRQQLAGVLQRLARGHRIKPFETVRRRKDGTLIAISISFSAVGDANKVIGVATIARDITERKRAQEQQQALQQRLLSLATTDPVTALLNHRGLMAQLEQELERVQRYGRSCSILFVDLDHFKALNDGYGHATGDAVLYEFADLVRSQLRRMDTMGRWGGEEFVVILPEMQAEEALHVAETVRATVAAHTFHAGGIHLTCSIGLASAPMHAQEREALLRAADQAMDAAKHFGRNQVRTAHDPAVLALFAASHSQGGREEAALVGMAEALVALVEARDHSTGSHCQQVADLVHQLALGMGWPASEAQMLKLAARLHDLGKVAVPDTILQKPGELTREEKALMQQHSAVGAEVVRHIPALRPLAPVIRAHHERWDGQGYPDRLVGEAIPVGARILTVVDAYLAMITDRPYQPARAPADAMAELRGCAGSQFDPQVVDVLLSLLQ